MKEKIFVTESGRLSLLKRKDELVAQLRDAQFSKGKAAAGDSNSWHDNAEYDTHARNEMMLAEQVAELIELIENSSVVDLPQQNDRVAIGHVVTLEIDDEQTKRYEVGGFGETDLGRTPKRLSYDAPILRDFMGKSVGHRATMTTGGKTSAMLLVEIAMKSSSLEDA